MNRVFLDSNVIFSRTLRDWFGLLTTTGEGAPPFQVYWSDDVIAEAMYHVRRENPAWEGGQIASIGEKIRAMWADGRVRDFVVDDSYAGQDPHDAHVHAAAVACRAHYLVTRNVGDFRTDDTDALPYEVYHPDEFFLLVDDVAPALVAHCVQQQIAYWSGRQDDVDVVGALNRNDCPEFASRVLSHLRREALGP